MAAELGQKTVEFSALVSRAAEDSFVSLKELVEKSKFSDVSDTEKKISLLKYLLKTQQRMLRLNVLAKWCKQVPLIQYSQQLASTLSSHDTCFTQAADSLFFMHEGLQQARAPVYDVPSAIEVLLTGSYERLPKCIEDVGVQGILTEDEQKPALKKLETLVRSKLLEVSLPQEISEVKIMDGKAVLCVDGEFKVEVTLGYRGHLSLWRILNVELLVGERKGFVKLEELRRRVLGDDLECRMAGAENPFVTLYSVLHELCVALVMDTVLRQVNSLRQERWKDAIRFELISGGVSGSGQLNQDGEADSSTLQTPGVKIIYWLDIDKSSGTSDTGFSCPFIKIEPGPDLLIKCIHSSFVIDPLTGKEAEFSIDQSCIDVEKLLLRAICCNRYTRLLEIQKELRKNIQIFRTATDVFLQHPGSEPDVDHKKKDNKSDSKDYEGQEMLYVRAYSSSFFALGINIRNGRFLLQSFQTILAPTTLIEYEEGLNQGTMTASDVFINLRSRSILHLFASINRFLGLEVYEYSYNALKFPKNIFDGSPLLLSVFPDSGNSYILSMQIDKDFKPQFKLLETDLDASGKAHSLKDLGNVKRIKIIDVNEIQMHQNELNLNLLDWRKQLHLPNSGGNQSSEPSLPNISFDSTFQIAGSSLSTFSSVVDEVFGLEKRLPSMSPLSVQNLPSSSNISMNLYNIRAATSSPMQSSQSNNILKVSTVAPHYNGSLHSSVNLKVPVQSASLGSLSSSTGKGTAIKRILTSKSEQDLSLLRSNFGEISSHPVMDEDHMRILNSTSKDGLYRSKPSRLLSPPRYTGTRLSLSSKSNGAKTSLAEPLTGSMRFLEPSSSAATPESQIQDIATCFSPGYDIASKKEKVTRKRTVSDMLSLIPSLHCVEANTGVSKRRKVSESIWYDQPPSQMLTPTEMVLNTEGYSYGHLIAEANKGTVPSSIYVSALLHVIKHCSVCIKHARLTSQLEAQGIPYVEEVGLRSASSNIWFRLPFAQGDCWQNICLRLGRPGIMFWDVKINDEHFKDLWELQKGGCGTPWGSGVRIANTSDIDSHICYDPEGVVLSYQSVEDDSIKKLVADLLRLSNARTFSIGMRKLLGIHADEKLEENAGNSDAREPLAKGAFETIEKLSEKTRRTFKIEAVGLMSLWFSFESGVLARFVVEWESGKGGCTMHVSPDQLWPHTKFLEDFINGADVASLLDCIRLTAGPLHALGTATRPARAGPVSILPSTSATFPSIAKQGGYTPTQSLLPGNSVLNAGQVSTVPVGSPAAPAANGSHPNSGLHGATMLTAGRGGPGIVPSSLLPIDVSVVLRGPYWIRIIYRKQFAVDMRCFAGDQIWLQPATPAKANPSIGGSLPCPQFRPFIMEHVAQELNVLEPNFSGGNPTAGLSASNNQNLSLSSQLSAANGSRVNLLGSSALSRTGNQINSLNRVGNVLSASPNFAASSGLSLRRTQGGVPAHVKGELNTAIIGLGDDGGYGGGWVPLVALKKVLRGILKYLGVLWLFAQIPDLLKEILGSILKENEGSLLNLDPEQPALRFFVGGYVFAVSVHRVQLLLQVLSVKRFHHQQQQLQSSTTAPEELTQLEIGEICEYFSRRVASEPYDASRVASFITLLTLPISVLREFLKLIAWKKGLVQAQGGDIAPAQKPRIELCLESHSGLSVGKGSKKSSASKSNIHYDRPHNSVDFALTVVLDPAHIPHINAAGGAAWLPYCTSVRLRYSFSENPLVSFVGMEGSHGGQACWSHVDEWERCKQRVARTVEVSGNSIDISQGRLKVVADSVQRTVHMSVQALRDSSEVSASSAAS